MDQDLPRSSMLKGRYSDVAKIACKEINFATKLGITTYILGARSVAVSTPLALSPFVPCFLDLTPVL